ncbi:MAG: hypothetical protein M1839_001930 [Geoglossum umbratile]|nr:MAG: hypothetical protein M1839_001930 [Geoglossum umbratile]
MSTASGSSSMADAAAECLRARQSFSLGSRRQNDLNSVSDLKKIKAAYDSNLAKIGDQLQLTPRESTEFSMYHQYSTALHLLGDPQTEIRDLKAYSAFCLDVIKTLQQEVRRLRNVDEGNDRAGSIVSVQPENQLNATRGEHDGPATTTRPWNHLDIFIRSPTDQLWTRRLSNLSSWDNFVHLGGNFILDPVAISPNPNCIDLFVVHNGWALYRKSWDGRAWVGWEHLGYTNQSPSAVCSGVGKVDVFYVTHDTCEIKHRIWTGTVWSPQWMSLGGVSTSAPVAISRGQNLIDLFFVGRDGDLNWKSWSDMRWKPSTTTFTLLGEKCKGTPAAVSWDRETIDVFVLGIYGDVLHKTWNGRAWEPSELGFNELGGSFASQPVVVSRGPEKLDLFIIGKDNMLYYKGLSKSGWKPSTGFHRLGGGFLESIAPSVVVSGDRLDIFLVGAEPASGELFHTSVDKAWPLSTLEYDSLGRWSCTSRVGVVERHGVESNEK